LGINSPRLRNLFNRCWKQEPELRPTVDQVIEELSELQVPVWTPFLLLDKEVLGYTSFGSIHPASHEGKKYMAYVVASPSSYQFGRWAHTLSTLWENCRKRDSARFLSLPLSPDLADVKTHNRTSVKALIFPFSAPQRLQQYLASRPYNRADRLSIALSLSEGVKLLHELGFAHCAINWDTVLVQEDQSGEVHAVLGGIERIIDVESGQCVVENSLGYQAHRSVSAMDADIFALGSVLAQLASETLLAPQDLEIMQKTQRLHGPSLPFLHSSVVEQCWSSPRPSFGYIIEELSSTMKRPQ
jgi:serine/threonine protein kinase